MPVFVSTLTPGLLVNIHTSIKGNVSYVTSEDREIVKRGGAIISTWETERTVKDPKEQKAATEIRSKARNLVVGVCAVSEFGLLCPESKRAALDEAFDKARKLCTDFNKTAKTTRIKFNAIAGTIAADNVSAVRAINSEVRDLLSEMQDGIKALDVERVRDAASRTKKLGNMLAPEMQERIETAISAVRKQAKAIVKAGDQAATAIDKVTLKTLKEARTAFLDLDPAVDVVVPAPSTARALDLHPEAEAEAPAKPKAKGKARELELQ